MDKAQLTPQPKNLTQRRNGAKIYDHGLTRISTDFMAAKS